MTGKSASISPTAAARNAKFFVPYTYLLRSNKAISDPFF
jgi:hypothetical protein